MADKKYYDVLQLNSNCTDEDLYEKYHLLRDKYSEERFCEGEKGNRAAKLLTEIETAYAEIKAERDANNAQHDSSNSYYVIEEKIRCGQLNDAQEKLDLYTERDAEWHYLQSVVFYKKNWTNESKKQLEIALKLEPDNSKYKSDYEKLKAETDYNAKNFSSNNAPHGGFAPDERQMGGNDCLSSCCQCLACNMLLNCCCNCH